MGDRAGRSRQDDRSQVARTPRIRLRRTLPWVVVVLSFLIAAAVLVFTFIAVLWALAPTT